MSRSDAEPGDCLMAICDDDDFDGTKSYNWNQCNDDDDDIVTIKGMESKLDRPLSLYYWLLRKKFTDKRDCRIKKWILIDIYSFIMCKDYSDYY